jgi:hypothetical protein
MTTTLKANTNSTDLDIFKVPMVPNKIPMSLKPVETAGQAKKPKVFNELKVFNNLTSAVNNNATSNNNFNTTKQSLSSTGIFDEDVSKLNDLPKSSTPIYTDNTSSAYLLAKRNKIFNAKLDLTITGTANMNGNLNNFYSVAKAEKQYQPQIPERVDEELAGEENRAASNSGNSDYAMLPKLNMIQSTQSNSKENLAKAAGSSLKSMVALRQNNQMAATAGQTANTPLGQESRNNKMSMHDMSLIAAYENATTSTNLVSVAKVQLPKYVKKSIKEEIKKDKTKCVIS